MLHKCLGALFKLFIILPIIGANNNNDIFQQDLSDKMKIGVSDNAFKKVQLKCGSNSMLVDLETVDDFYGVIYTRGSFYDRNSPCFIDSGDRGQRSFSIKFSLDKCKTEKNGDTYRNVLVLQHDKDLIMPGDSAFDLECNFDKPREVIVNANLQEEISALSRITLVDPDPAAIVINKRDLRKVESKSNIVVLTSKHWKQLRI